MKRSAGELSLLMQLLDEALELPEEARLTWLDALQGEHARLRDTLRGMLLSAGAPDTAEFAQLEQRIAGLVWIGLTAARTGTARSLSGWSRAMCS